MSDSPNSFQGLASALKDRSATVAVVGMGYVGIPLAEAMLDAGFQLLLFDIDERKAHDLNQGVCYLEHLGAEVFEKLKQSD
ncbi:MAG: NAD(P)-binding domain-containing protein, partial [bacterium]